MGSCRCGVNQETQSSIADFPNLLLNKAQVGLLAKNCKRVLIIVKSLLFFKFITLFTTTSPEFIILFLHNEKKLQKSTKCLERSQTTVLHTFSTSALIPRTADLASKVAMAIITSRWLQTHHPPCLRGGTSLPVLPHHLRHLHCPWRLLLANSQPLLVLCSLTKNLQHQLPSV